MKTFCFVKRNQVNTAFLILCFSFISSIVLAQEEKKEHSLKVTSDIVSSYIWRGGLVDLNPNIQPTLAYTKGGFEIGAWGSSNLTATYKEFDLYAQYSFKSLTVGVYDCYWPSDWSNKNYFIYKKDNTNHIYEGFLKYTGPDAFPISILATNWFYGDDKYSSVEYPNDSTKWGNNRYSTYFELIYPFAIAENNLDVFIGGTPQQNVYGTGPGIVNLGVTAYRSIKITENFELPIKAQIIVNPQSEKVFMVFGITL